MINAKEAREISEKHKNYSLLRIESEILLAAKQGRTSYSFFALDKIKDSIFQTLSELGYNVKWYPVSIADKMLQFIISW
jgi:hypothetical protein